jgi:hypothetical protein
MSSTTLEFSCLRSWEVPSKSWTERTWKNLNLSRIHVERWASGLNAQCCAKFLQALGSSSISLCMPCHPPLCIVQITMPEFLYSGFKLKISWASKLLQIYLCFSSTLLILWCWYGELILSFFMWKLRIMFVSQIVHCDQRWDSRCWMGLKHICGFSRLALTRRMQRYTAIRLRIAMIKPMHSKSFWQRFTTISNPLWIIVPYVSPYDDRSPQSWAYDLHFKFCDPSTCDATLQCFSSWI